MVVTETVEKNTLDSNDDADVNAVANKVNDKNKGMVVTETVEKNTLEYQDTMNVDIEKYSSKRQQYWRSI